MWFLFHQACQNNIPPQVKVSTKFIQISHQNPLKKIVLSPIQGAGFINKARARCSLTFLGIGAVWPNHSPPTITTCQKDSPGMLLGKEVWSFRSFFWSKNIIISHFQTLNIYGIFAYINHKFMGKCIPYIHGASGSGFSFYIKVQLESIEFSVPRRKRLLYTCQYSKQKHSTKPTHKHLVGGWTTHFKHMLVKLDHFPRYRGEN